ncbi:hypothetical protein [Aquisediminimonas profunda]|uniref:hypothetical protein n=1 Tax=Aquisediminimonas profunda TaxID=1550733 RepID=UPI001C628153|nr:hypothetical protein [Aquisediminimonas profunda]
MARGEAFNMGASTWNVIIRIQLLATDSGQPLTKSAFRWGFAARLAKAAAEVDEC